MCGLEAGHTINVNPDQEKKLIELGYLAKEEKVKRKTKEEKSAKVTKDDIEGDN